ncbi:MAG: ParM/StbA family protein [Ktedonobacteraceae bacterium]|nr:ParM/StbA family protein [Ktedonobacteraceae bacterium]
MHYNEYGYGHDYGNSKTCGIAHIAGEQRVMVMPSAILRGSHETLQARLSGSGSANSLVGLIGPASHTVSFINQAQERVEYYVGDLAINQAPSGTPISALTSRGIVERYWSDSSVALLLATSGSLIRDPEYGLHVVTNLPIATFNDANAKRVKMALDGDYIFSLDGIERRAHINVRKTIMEAAGANIAYGVPGAQEKVAIVDIGGRTTDAYLVKGQLPINDQCESADLGVETAGDRIIQAFEQRFDYPLTMADARELLRLSVSGQQYLRVPSVANAGADVVEVGDLIERELRAVGEEIAKFLKRLWSSSLKRDVVLSDVSKVLLIGGGAYYFSTDLQPLFKNRLMVIERPEYANARGYAKLAQHFLQREIKARFA